MASSSTLKSQPLHNFQLHDLKWAMNHPSNHRLRKSSDSFHKSPQRGDTDSESDNNRRKNPVCEAPSENLTRKSERKFINGSAEDIEELVPKTWNLRPRKPISKPTNNNGSATKIGGPAQENRTHRSEATRSRNITEPKPAEKKEKKQKFSISLSREEIDEDIFAMTGSKASRRPKKRAKNVQKQLDCVFPGLWLASITPDCYRVSDANVKG
ncbi:hypothetical protein V6N12_059492 [Hibiscus sabdariffa]